MKRIFLVPACLLAVSLYGCNDYGKEKQFHNVQLFYTEHITEPQADSLGSYLLASGFDDSSKKTVQITKPADVYQFRMVVKKGLENDAAYVPMFKEFAGDISKHVFNGAPVELDACNDKMETLKAFPMK